ncbi:MAG TPA: TonB-dependent receptor [Gallionella sp.]|nr:TonB-dependent receptor [Gallionella sp.]
MFKPIKIFSIAAAIAAVYASTIPAPAWADDQVQTLPEVQVTGSPITNNAPGSLRNEIIKTESVSPQEIERSNADNLTEALDKRPGISVQVECSVCNVRNVTLNNLPGRFTTVLIDGIPLYSSVSNAYGLDSVNVQGIERIDIARGAGTSLIAPQALSGTVNIVTKRPTKDENVYKAEIGNYGAYEGDAYVGKPFDGGAVALSVDFRKHDTVDGVGMNLSQYTGYERQMAGFGYFLDDAGGFKVRSRIDLVHETRGGGPLGSDYYAIINSTTGNPFNFSAGPHGSPDPNGWVAPDGVSGPDTLSNGQNGVLYNSGAAGLAQIITTDRQQGTVIGERNAGDGVLRLATGLAHHVQDSYYGLDAVYDASQNQYYLESSYRVPYGDKLLTLGADYQFEDLRSTGYSFSTMTNNYGVDNYTYRTPGLFAQIYLPVLNNRLELNASMRVDKQNVFGTITSPRFNALYHHSDAYASRFSIGKGWRAPTSFFEQEHGILADRYIVRDITEPETSDNVSYALSYAADRISWVASANYNRIHNMAMLTPGQPDPLGGPCCVTIFNSSPDPVTVKGVDWVGTYQVTPGTAMTLGAEKFHYDFTPGTLNFSRPETRAYLTLDSDIRAWELTARLTWTGQQNLAKFYDYVDTQQYNLDGTPKLDWSPSFTVVDVRAQYRINRRYAAFFGADNLFDYQQAQHDSYLWTDSAGNLDVTHIWGPQIGRYVYAGMRMDL